MLGPMLTFQTRWSLSNRRDLFVSRTVTIAGPFGRPPPRCTSAEQALHRSGRRDRAAFRPARARRCRRGRALPSAECISRRPAARTTCRVHPLRRRDDTRTRRGPLQQQLRELRAAGEAMKYSPTSTKTGSCDRAHPIHAPMVYEVYCSLLPQRAPASRNDSQLATAHTSLPAVLRPALPQPRHARIRVRRS